MDEAILRWFTNRRTEGSLEFAHAVTLGGDIFVLTVIAVVAVLWLLRIGAYRPAAFYAVCCASSAIINFGLKFALDRPRPVSFFAPGVTVSSPSFPSGHALMSTVVYGAFVWLLCRGRPAPLLLVGAVCLLIGLTRLMLGVHWPSDVFIGWVIGLWLIVSLKWVYEPRPSSS